MPEPEDSLPASDESQINADAENPEDLGVDDDVPQLEPPVEDETPEREAEAVDLQQRPGSALQQEDGSEQGFIGSSLLDELPHRAGSPANSVLSGPRGSPSIPGSLLSSPGSSILPSRASRPRLSSPTPSFRPFDRRFQSRIPSATNSPRPASPAFLTPHSRNVSLTSQFVFDQAAVEAQTPPWEVVRWTRLIKISGQAFSESGRRNFGSPTCLSVSALIALGTSRGLILVFDYNQNLKFIIGQGTQAVASGPVTAIAISADHSTIAGGHANSCIFTWDVSRATRPFLSIPSLDESQIKEKIVEGHIIDTPVLHLGFLGTRHTALVSANSRGMAFSHLASRGTSALGRTVKTTRILGRYPSATKVSSKPMKPSTVLAFAPLPLGNTERETDVLGLTAMLTPYLLVIVSTTPVAQTQHKSARPKDLPAHAAMTGCLAWFPAVKLKTPDPYTGSELSKAKLVYCWSNVLSVLDVDELTNDDKERPSSLTFKIRSRWKCEEAIATVQWLSRSVLTVLTISQRLIVLEDRSMRMTEAFDLLGKHIYHTDHFSKQLHALVEQLDEDDQSMHGVVADAFYMSLKTYKGRMFLLGFNELSFGALSNWADRLIAMMEHEDYVGAIRLATSYYTGDANKLTVGLPEDVELRHSLVEDKIMEIITASLKYAFGKRRKGDAQADDSHLRQLAEICFTACEAVGQTDYLFDDMFEWYEEAGVTGLFHETLEPYILSGTMTTAPPAVVKDMANHFVANGWESRFEEVICRMHTASLDLDQITSLCKQHRLYDALIYVWNQALQDYITPLIDLLSLVVPPVMNGQSHTNMIEDENHSVDALKIFPYLAYTLSGRVYPSGEPMDDDIAVQTKSEIYWFFFSGKMVEWPKGSKRIFLAGQDTESETAFPYLRLILRYDAASFLSVLNEAFEDSFLNESSENTVRDRARMSLPEEQIFGLSINRQYILTILLDVLNSQDFGPEDTIYLDMFIARNLPKFPQYLLLPGSTLLSILKNLCHYPGADLAEDAQLSAEYLLSVYQPSDMPTLMPLFREAGFFRILKRIYRSEKQYGKLLTTYFEDPRDQDEVFETIGKLLRPQGDLNARRLQEVRQIIRGHAKDLLNLSPERTASTLAKERAEIHRHVLDSATEDPAIQHAYLKALLEPDDSAKTDDEGSDPFLVEEYIRLMCQFNGKHVSDFINAVQAVNLRLDSLLPTMEATGTINGAIALMARDGQIVAAMRRLVNHFYDLEAAVRGLMTAALEGQSSEADVDVSAEELLTQLQNYVHVGIWLCQGQTRSSKENVASQESSKEVTEDLSADENLWLSLIDASVQVTKNLAPMIQGLTDQVANTEKLLVLLRSIVQHTFTSLFTETSSQRNGQVESKDFEKASQDVSFLKIMRAFLNRAAASSPTMADLRSVLTSIFAAYAYEESMLRLSNRLLEQSLFTKVKEAVDLRQRGWRPRGSTCEACGERVWGPGVVNTAVLEAWEDKQAAEEAARKERFARATERVKGGGIDLDVKNKEKSPDTRPARAPQPAQVTESAKDSTPGPLVVLACRHIYHMKCLEALQERGEGEDGERERNFRCPIDG